MKKIYILLVLASLITTIQFFYLSQTTIDLFFPKTVILCANKKTIWSFQIHKNYAIFNNIIRANKQFNCDESVTLTTHADYHYLDNIPVLVKMWKGPISVALYAPGYDLRDTLTSIAFLRLCDNETSKLVRDFVTFHIFFEYKHIRINQEVVSSMAKIFMNNASVCNGLEAPFARMKTTWNSYKGSHNIKYPINVARNLARRNAQTHFVLASDIELYPSANFIKKFLKMISNYPLTLERKVFVLPVFEIESSSSIPRNKTHLQEMIRRGEADWFHTKICLLCHRVINGAKWLLANETQGLADFATGKRKGDFMYWEPFYVGTNNDPFFDERMTWESGSNKMTQAYVLCLLDYDFVVLDNAFLVHKPGIKKEIKFFNGTIKYKKIIAEIKEEYQERYKSDKLC